MRIDSNYVLNSPAPSPTAADTYSSSTASQPTEARYSESGQDAVQLSKLGSVLNGLAAGATSVLHRVATLAPLVQSGAYQVPSQLVANRIVSDALGAS
jgi:anti-sigma28 factor (negative regulator of flagellin synthesis)